MIINKNIFAKIIDNISLNKWKNKVKRINDEYHCTYSYIDERIMSKDNSRCCCSGSGSFTIYQYRTKNLNNYFDYVICNNTKKKCNKCNKIIYGYRKVSNISIKHHYSSGFDNLNGYKN